MIKEAINLISYHHNLTEKQAQEAINDVICGSASDVQIAAFLTGLRVKGETAAEISGGVKALRSHAVQISPKVTNSIDIVGTGGDQSGTFNISSASAMVAAAAGAYVAKHGNRSVSSRSGSADVFEKLGLDIQIDTASACHCLEKYHFVFLYAPLYHPAMKHAAPVRKALGIRTLFNLLGPLANPSAVEAMLLGVCSASLCDDMAQALSAIGVKRAMVVNSLDQTDEISLAAPTAVIEIHHGEKRSYRIQPEDFGFRRCSLKDLKGGSPEENAYLIETIFNGKPGPARDVIALNAGAALYLADIAKSIEEGCAIALETISSGKAAAFLRTIRQKHQKSENQQKAGVGL